ncbi:MAG: hypothetical protein HY082_11410 [Gammaproteobacteria bacterium]|nr:hypothetical protein [Gammaproteobacteria bacterium]
MNKYAVLFALLLAACATPTPRTPESTSPPKATAPVPESPAPAPDVARSVPAQSAPLGVPPVSVFREFVARNDERLLDVFVGMHKSELVRIMHADADRWHNPYKREALLDTKGAAYEVFYYLMRDPEGKPVKDRHLTPVIVRDDVVVAIGAYRLKKLKRGESLELPKRRASK